MINVVRLRNSLKETQAAFAERLGVSQTRVCRWEKGKAEPTGSALILLTQLEEQRIRKAKAVRSGDRSPEARQ